MSRDPIVISRLVLTHVQKGVLFWFLSVLSVCGVCVCVFLWVAVLAIVSESFVQLDPKVELAGQNLKVLSV